MDYDNRGVGGEGCETCHSTLDPLAYPFSRYEGIGGGAARAEPYSYNANRMNGFTDTEGDAIADTPEAGMLFGEKVDDLVEWASVAANSDAFLRATVLDYWKMLLGEPPRANEQAEFAEVIERFGGQHDFSVEAMLHDLIDTEAYGAP